MADNYLWSSGYRLAQIQVILEGMIVLYDIDVRAVIDDGISNIE